MLSILFKDRGSRYHAKATDENFEMAKTELLPMEGNSSEKEVLAIDIMEMISNYGESFDWFDTNALKNADKENLARYVWLLGRPYQLRLEEIGLAEKYGFSVDINTTEKEDRKFDKYFERRDKIGSRFYLTFGDNPDNWTRIFSASFQLTRIILGPFGFIMGKIPFVALLWFLLWVCAAFFDWIVLGLPYLIFKLSSGVPGDYFNSEMLIGAYLFGQSKEIQKETRELVKQDAANSNAYETALWGIFMREKLIEIIRKVRKDETVAVTV